MVVVVFVVAVVVIDFVVVVVVLVVFVIDIPSLGISDAHYRETYSLLYAH